MVYGEPKEPPPTIKEIFAELDNKDLSDAIKKGDFAGPIKKRPGIIKTFLNP